MTAEIHSLSSRQEAAPRVVQIPILNWKELLCEIVHEENVWQRQKVPHEACLALEGGLGRRVRVSSLKLSAFPTFVNFTHVHLQE